LARRRITSYDVARRAGVSQTTVSLVLNRVAAANISDETRRRVVAAAEQLGYIPDAAAQALVRGRTRIIGVVVTTLDDPFIGALVQAIESAAHDRGYVVILTSYNDIPEREIAAAEMLQSRRVDGVIVTSSRTGALYGGRLEQPRPPVVLINSLAQRSDGPFFSVGVDNRHGGYMATSHLIQKGHRRIAYVASPPDRNDNTERMAGYRQALAEALIPLDPSLLVPGTGDIPGGQQALPVLMSRGEPPSAVFCYNDMTAIGLIDAARRMGLSIPQELAVVGFDDIAFAQLCHPSLTTIAQPIAELGRRAVERMLVLLSEDAHSAAPGRNVTIEGQLVVRESSG
jgi:LacI family repressor for deo operon, udp, cdd, tsx, nupC, and nupG